MASIYLIYCTVSFIVLLFISGAQLHHAQNAYDDLVTIGFSWAKANSDMLPEFVGPSGPHPTRNETHTFRIVTHKMEKWKEILGKHNDVNAELVPWPQKRTIISISKKIDEMDLAELTMLYYAVSTTRNSLIIDSEDESSGRITILVRSAANCSFRTSSTKVSPVIYFCNGFSNELIKQIETTYGLAIIPLTDGLESENKVSFRMPCIFASAAHVHHSAHQSHAAAHHAPHPAHKVHHDPHQHHAFNKYRKKRVYKKKFELLKLRRKEEALQKTRKAASDVLEVPMARRKLLCKYRKSCYDTGIVPDTWNIFNILPRFVGPHAEQKNFTEIDLKGKMLTKEENETKEEISETELKLLCRYRKSCYEEVGAEIEKGGVNVQVVSILARRFAIVLPPKRQKTIQEIANIALARIEEKERIAALRPIPKKVIIDKKLNEIEEEMKKRLACKYRKSCYESGVLPEIASRFSNPFPRIYHFLRQQIRGPSVQEIIHKEFSDLDEDKKKIYCKYRKSCYATGEKPIIEHGQLFKYVHIVKKQEELIPLEIRCKYRKSCYETGILPDLGKKKVVEEKAPAEPVQKITSLYQLKLLCRYRISCYKRKAQESSGKLFEEIVKLGKVEEERKPEVKKEDTLPPLPAKEKPKKRKESVKLEESEKKKVIPTQAAFAPAAEMTRKAKVKKIEEPETKKIAEPKAKKTEEPKPKKTEEPKPKKPGKVKVTKELKSAPEAEPKPEVTEEEKMVKKPQTPEMKKKKIVEKKKVEKIVQKPKKRVIKEPTDELKERPSRKYQKVSAPPPTTAKPVTEKKVPKPAPKKEVAKPKKVEKEIKEIKPTRIKKEKPAKEKELPVKKEVERVKKPEKESPVVPLKTTEMPPPIKKVEPAFSRPKNITPEMPPKKVNIYDENLSPLEIKLLCKYRKSCYEKGELPPILQAKTIKHLKEKDEQHKPLELRCKYRKSCYETGKLPENLHENFKVVHLIKKKEEHLSLPLRCKYRKSCYETGKLPPIETNIFGFSALQNFLKKYEEENEFVKRELSEDEKKLRCKYRKSCYATGILPPRLNQTVHVIASSIKEQYMSPQLKCKYRKSCYESMKLDVLLDKVREKEKQKKPQEGIVKVQYPTEPTIKYKEKVPKESVSEEELTDEEREQLSKERGKKMKPGADEQEYMQIGPLDMQPRPTVAKSRPLSKSQKLKCKYRLKCYDGVPLDQVIEEKRIEKERQVNIKDFRRANGAICNIYYISCRKQAGLPIRERAPIGPNGRRLCRKKKKNENAS